MKKENIFILFVVMLILPIYVGAKNEDENFISESTKYYKTIEYRTNLNSYSLYSNNLALPKTIEVSEEEYNSYNEDNNIIMPMQSVIVTTSYKKMTTSITKNGNYYRYKNEVYWKQNPVIRSYDIIAIGFNSNVKPRSNINFKLTYTNSSGNTTTSTTNYPRTFSTGVGTTFKMPTGENIYNITATLYFDVEKNTTATLRAQDAYGDYSHAVKTISLDDAKRYTVDAAGINLNSAVLDSYDEISNTIVTVTATW